ncbi:MAG: ABC transporter permease subunit [Cyclobacteriaceae bacterium]
MGKIWIITRRELASFFDSLIAYVLIALFLLLSGIFTWLASTNVFFIGQATMQVFFSIAFWSLFFFIPAITMRMIAEENRAGTIELLTTKAVSDSQIVWGKFLACLILVAVALFATLPYYVTISQLGNIDDGAVIGGYIGLLLLSASYISIGLFASSITQNQIVAFLLALAVGILFQLIFDVLGNSVRGAIGETLSYLSMSVHFESISRGVVDSRDLVYFASIIVLGTLLSQMMLSKRNWQS